jgi:S-adenosylmethionine synthetase
VHVNTFGTGEVADFEIADAVGKVFDFRPGAIIERLDLRKPIYTPTAAYGHFGRTPETRVPDAGGTEPVRFFPWEETDLVGDLRSAAGA